MATRLISVVVDALDPRGLARFWAAALDWQITVDEPGEVAVEDGVEVEWGDGGTPCLTFVPVREPKTGKNRVHLDLASSTEHAQRQTVQRLLGLGARRVNIGQGQAPWIVLADPESNELCVLEPRQDYTGAGPIAAVVLDCRDPAGLAAFWSQATTWPASAHGTGLIALWHPTTAAAPRLELLASQNPKQGKNRVHLDVAPPPREALDREVARLESAGGRRIDIGQRGVSWVVLADPDGNELCVLTPR